MKLVVLTAEEYEELQHFVEKGTKKDGVHATDSWIEEMVKKAVEEIGELRNRCDIFWDTCDDYILINQAARKLYKAHKKGESLDKWLKVLGLVIHGKKKKARAALGIEDDADTEAD